MIDPLFKYADWTDPNFEITVVAYSLSSVTDFTCCEDGLLRISWSRNMIHYHVGRTIIIIVTLLKILVSAYEWNSLFHYFTLDITRIPKLYTSSVSTITQFVDILMYFPTIKERVFKLTCFRGQSFNIIGF